MVSRIYRSLKDQRGLFFPSHIDWRTIDLHTYADADLVHTSIEVGRTTNDNGTGVLVTEMAVDSRNVYTGIKNYRHVGRRTQYDCDTAFWNTTPTTINGVRGQPRFDTNGFGSQRSTHLALKHHYIVELERNGRITSRKINSSDNLADVFTKALPAPQYLKLIDRFTVRLRNFDFEGARLLSKS
eukprot:g48431.t1